MMPVSSSPSSTDEVIERFDTVTREAMVQLHRWQSEREEWDRQREELRRALERTSSERVQLMVIPLKATLRQAIERIDRLLSYERGE